MTPDIRSLLDEILSKLDAQNLESIRNLTEEQVPGFHFSLGLYIRNSFIYPKDSIFGQAALSLVGDADAISTIVLICLWHHLNDRPITHELLVEQLVKRIWILEEGEADTISAQLLGNKGDVNT
ncbi:DUF6794 domain-containing protein [Comamonas koreensis]|uniref:DUF6794 domain-containing protein n=1 Tax=Comamonas koreensis TaxID=160825 RepID=UPI0015F944B5|nr:DUF6794 domain-containing protein [Comamonas koreensis]